MDVQPQVNEVKDESMLRAQKLFLDFLREYVGSMFAVSNLSKHYLFRESVKTPCDSSIIRLFSGFGTKKDKRATGMRSD